MADIDIGKLCIALAMDTNGERYARIKLPDGSEVVEPFSAEGTLQMNLKAMMVLGGWGAWTDWGNWPSDSAPEWVPAGYDIWIEPRVLDGFPNGRAWVAGTGIVAVNTLLGTDPNSENYQGASAYDPANLTADGLAENGIVALIGEARTRVIAGATTVIKWSVPESLYFLIHDAAGGHLVYLEANEATDLLAVMAGSTSDEIVDAFDPGVNALAVTATATRLEAAMTGSTPVVLTLTAGDWDAAVAVIDTQAPIQSIGIRTDLAAAASLPTLSAVS